MERESVAGRVSQLVAEQCPAAQELVAALEYVKADPAASLAKSRLVLEEMHRAMFEFEGWQQPGKQRMVGQLLQDQRLKQRLRPALRAAMEYVNEVSAAEGAHPGESDARTAGRVLDHICDTLEWYVWAYLPSGLRDNFGEALASDCLLLYVSTGGTCRCAMANVITRHYLRSMDASPPIRPMSVALHTPTRTSMTEEAVQVVREGLGISFPEHRTVHADERYFRRARLVLAMDAKLLRQLPTLVAGKAHLFTEYLGGQGSIEDPYEHGIDTYRERFQQINGLIRAGLSRIVELANQPLHPTAATPSPGERG